MENRNGEEVNYYAIILTNFGIAQMYEARNVRLNGRPLINLDIKDIQGRLEFVAVPAHSHHFHGIVARISQGTRTISQIPAISSYTQGFLGGLRNLVGLTITMVLTKPQTPSQSQAVTGRITGVVSDPSDSSREGLTENLSFNFEKF